MTIVDSTHPDQQKREPPKINEILSRYYFEGKLLGLTLPFGLPRLIDACGGAESEIGRLQRRIECRRQTVKASETELNALDASANELHDGGSLGDMPLVVLWRDPNTGGAPGLVPPDLSQRIEAQWLDMQEELIPNSSYVCMV